MSDEIDSNAARAARTAAVLGRATSPERIQADAEYAEAYKLKEAATQARIAQALAEVEMGSTDAGNTDPVIAYASAPVTPAEIAALVNDPAQPVFVPVDPAAVPQPISDKAIYDAVQNAPTSYPAPRPITEPTAERIAELAGIPVKANAVEPDIVTAGTFVSGDIKTNTQIDDLEARVANLEAQGAGQSLAIYALTLIQFVIFGMAILALAYR